MLVSHLVHVFCCCACSYGMRYVAKVLKNSLHEKFPDATEDELLKVNVLSFAIHTPFVHVADIGLVISSSFSVP